MGIEVKDIPTHWLKPYDFDFGTFFQIKKPPNAIQKLSFGPVPCTHYIIPYARYKKLKLGSLMEFNT
jgi:hypothetical protein